METKRDYGIQRKGIWYDPFEGTTSVYKSEGSIYFPSLSEFECFLKLQKIFVDGYKVEVHRQVRGAGIAWEVDFCIRALTDLNAKKLAVIVNAISGKNFSILREIFIEYKGFADKNFRYRVNALHRSRPLLLSTIILLSKEPSIYKLNEGLELKILSVAQFRSICSMIKLA